MTPDPEDPSTSEPGDPEPEDSTPRGPGPLSLPHCRKCKAIAHFNPDGSIECDNCGIVAE